MKARYFERCLAETYLAATPATLDILMRELRRVGLVPVGGRGNNAPDISPRNVAAILIGRGCASVASGAGERVLQYCELVQPAKADAPKLIDALAEYLSDSEDTELEEVRISRHHWRAEFVYRDGTSIIYLPPGADLKDDDPYGIIGDGRGRFCRDEFVISSLMICHIAIDF
jgi:hypothetical protein